MLEETTCLDWGCWFSLQHRPCHYTLSLINMVVRLGKPQTGTKTPKSVVSRSSYDHIKPHSLQHKFNLLTSSCGIQSQGIDIPVLSIRHLSLQILRQIAYPNVCFLKSSRKSIRLHAFCMFPVTRAGLILIATPISEFYFIIF